MDMWNKKPLKIYGGRMSESMLAILSHIIKGEIIIQVKYLQKIFNVIADDCDQNTFIRKQVRLSLSYFPAFVKEFWTRSVCLQSFSTAYTTHFILDV
jgi:hypothetical protein